jgi:hypothetical protein
MDLLNDVFKNSLTDKLNIKDRYVIINNGLISHKKIYLLKYNDYILYCFLINNFDYYKFFYNYKNNFYKEKTSIHSYKKGLKTL